MCTRSPIQHAPNPYEAPVCQTTIVSWSTTIGRVSANFAASVGEPPPDGYDG